MKRIIENSFPWLFSIVIHIAIITSIFYILPKKPNSPVKISTNIKIISDVTKKEQKILVAKKNIRNSNKKTLNKDSDIKIEQKSQKNKKNTAIITKNHHQNFTKKDLNKLNKIIRENLNNKKLKKKQEEKSENILDNSKDLKKFKTESKKQQIIKTNKAKKKITQNKDDDNKITILSYSPNIYKIGTKQNPLPPYPRIAKLRQYQGQVKIKAILNYNGNVIKASIFKSSKYPILDNSALRTIKNWKLDIKNNGNDNNKNYAIIVPINFILEK